MHTSAINAIGAGLNVFVAATLIVAAVVKVRNIQPVERLLVATLPRRVWRVPGVDSRRLGRAAALVEAAGGVALLAAGRVAYPVISAALVIPLLVIAAVAVRAASRKVPCGCFGPSHRRAGRYEIGRAFFLLATTLSLTGLTWYNPAADPTTGSLTVAGWALAVVLTAVAVVPPRRRGRRRSVTAQAHSDGAEHSRRRVLHGIGLTTAAVLGAAVIAPDKPGEMLTTACRKGSKSAPVCSSPCQLAYDRCVGADSRQKQCCIDCYVACQGGGGPECTPNSSCNGQWPNPNDFNYGYNS